VTDSLSKLASKVLSDGKAANVEVKRLAASVLSQIEIQVRRTKKKN